MKQMKLLNTFLSASTRLKTLTGKIHPGNELIVSGVSESQAASGLVGSP